MQANHSVSSIDLHCLPYLTDRIALGSSFPSSSPTKPQSTAPEYSANTVVQGDIPLPSLVSLNLAANRLKASAFAEDEISSLPPNIKHLDLTSNGISGRLPFSLLASLSSLRTLLLSDNGLDDDFFSGPSSDGAFPALAMLDLSKNAIDSLQFLDERFSNTHTIGYQGIASASLRRAIASTTPPSDNSNLPALSIDVTGNYLREEVVRRRKMKVHNKVTTDLASESSAPPQPPSISNGVPAGYANSEARALQALADIHTLIKQWSKAAQGDPSSTESFQTKLDALPGVLANWQSSDVAHVHTPTASIFPSASMPSTPQVRVAKESDNSSISSDTSFIASAAERRRRLKEAEQAWAPL